MCVRLFILPNKVRVFGTYLLPCSYNHSNVVNIGGFTMAFMKSKILFAWLDTYQVYILYHYSEIKNKSKKGYVCTEKHFSSHEPFRTFIHAICIQIFKLWKDVYVCNICLSIKLFLSFLLYVLCTVVCLLIFWYPCRRRKRH